MASAVRFGADRASSPNTSSRFVTFVRNNVAVKLTIDITNLRVSFRKGVQGPNGGGAVWALTELRIASGPGQ
jgi:hypothetical protein